MDFAKYQDLARKVLPDHAEQINSMDDEKAAHIVVGSLCALVDASTLTDFGRADLFSLRHMADTQVHHWVEFGRSFWKKDRVKVK